MQKTKIKISFFGVLMLFALIFTHSYISLAALLAAAIHEIGHILAAKVCRIPLRELKLDIFGASLSTNTALYSYKKEFFLAAAGPLANIVSTIILSPILKNSSSFGQLFLSASLFLGILNLLPIADFDGGRITRCITCQIFSHGISFRICETLSFLSVICLWLISVYLLLRRSASLSLFVFSLSLFFKLFVRQKN